MFLTRDANFRLEMVYSLQEWWLEHVTMRLVRQFPTKDSCNSLVSLDSRKGTCSCPFIKALIVFPRQDRERLIFLASSSDSPSALLLYTFSLPARSIKLSLDLMSCPSWFLCSTVRTKMKCDREEF